MSVEIPLADIPDDLKQELIKKLTITPVPTKSWKKSYGKKPDIYCFTVTEEKIPMVHLPLHLSFGEYSLENSHLSYPTIEAKFQGQLREPQIPIEAQIASKLTTCRTALLSAHPGFGKTTLGIYLACKLGLVTLIVSHRNNIIDQWKETIVKQVKVPDGKGGLLSPRIQTLTSSSAPNEQAQFILTNTPAILKLGRSFFRKVGFVIVDEVHAFCTDRSVQAFLMLTPRYSLALSATPYKPDTSGKIIDFFFGTEKVSKALYVPHDVFRLNTGFVPTVVPNAQGNMDWNEVLKSEANDLNRNLLIVRLCAFFSKDVIMILCKRKDQTSFLYNLLKDLHEDVEIFVASAKTYNKQARILVSTYSKGGTGFDNINIDCLIIAGDVEEYIDQYAGRLRHTKHSKIIDLVNNLKTCIAHYGSRKKYYLSTGGNIYLFESKFPEFKSFNLNAELIIRSSEEKAVPERSESF